MLMYVIKKQVGKPVGLGEAYKLKRSHNVGFAIGSILSKRPNCGQNFTAHCLSIRKILSKKISLVKARESN